MSCIGCNDQNKHSFDFNIHVYNLDHVSMQLAKMFYISSFKSEDFVEALSPQ